MKAARKTKISHDPEIGVGDEQRQNMEKKRKKSSEIGNLKQKVPKVVAKPVAEHRAIPDSEAEGALRKRNIVEKKPKPGPSKKRRTSAETVDRKQKDGSTLVDSKAVEESVGADIVIYGSEGPHGKRRSVEKRIIEDPTKSNVIYVGRIPHGFYEKQMREFFEQFGTISKLRISRNKETGHSKHYGFIAFESPEVAAIAAESMNNYLLFESLLQVKVFPVEKQHPRMWIGANQANPEEMIKKMFLRNKRLQNRVQDPAEQKPKLHNLLRKDHKKHEKLKAAGIDFDFPNLRDRLPGRPKKTKFTDDK